MYQIPEESEEILEKGNDPLMKGEVRISYYLFKFAFQF